MHPQCPLSAKHAPFVQWFGSVNVALVRISSKSFSCVNATNFPGTVVAKTHFCRRTLQLLFSIFAESKMCPGDSTGSALLSRNYFPMQGIDSTLQCLPDLASSQVISLLWPKDGSCSLQKCAVLYAGSSLSTPMIEASTTENLHVEWHGLYLPLKRVGQAPHQAVEDVVWQGSLVKIGHHRLYHTRISLRETLSLCFFS